MYTEKNASEIFLQIMSAITYCHNQGITHCDLKPQNLMYAKEGDEIDNPIKLIDFGLSQRFNIDEKLTDIVGTFEYSAPEVLNRNFSFKNDIWSAGVILYYLLSGNLPFKDRREGYTKPKIMNIEYDFPEKQWKNISSEAIDLIRHMICKEEERYTAQQVLEHPWLIKAKENNSSLDNSFNVESMEKFFYSCKLKRIIYEIIATKIPEEEVVDLKKAFVSFDENKDGQISLEEFKNGLNRLNYNFDDDTIKMLFNKIDANKNMKIDYNEFIAATINKRICSKINGYMEAFSVLDKNGDGVLSKDEILDVLKVDPEHLKIVEKLIKEVDLNQNGVIEYSEFLRLLYENEIKN